MPEQTRSETIAEAVTFLHEWLADDQAPTREEIALASAIALVLTSHAVQAERIRLARTAILRIGLTDLEAATGETREVLRAALHEIETPLLADTKVVAHA